MRTHDSTAIINIMSMLNHVFRAHPSSRAPKQSISRTFAQVHYVCSTPTEHICVLYCNLSYNNYYIIVREHQLPFLRESAYYFITSSTTEVSQHLCLSRVISCQYNHGGPPTIFVFPISLSTFGSTYCIVFIYIPKIPQVGIATSDQQHQEFTFLKN